MTMDDTDEYDVEPIPVKEKLSVWVVFSILWQFYGNIFSAFVMFWEELSFAFVAHNNYRVHRKGFADSVMEDINAL